MAKKSGKYLAKTKISLATAAIIAILFATGFFIDKKFILQTASFILGGIYLAYVSSTGLIRKPKKTEGIWALIALGILVFLGRYDEAQTGLLFYSVYFAILNVFKENIKSQGEEFQLSYRNFLRDYDSSVKLHNSLILPIAIIISVITFILNKKSVDIWLYSFALSLVGFSLFYYYDLLAALSFFGVIKLAKEGIYVNDSKSIGNKFYDNIIMEDEGILTDGMYEITAVRPLDDYTKDELIELLAYAHYYSKSPARDCFIKAYGKKIYPNLISDFTENNELGVSLSLAEDVYRIGKLPLIESIGVHPLEPDICQIILYILKNDKQIGSVEISSHMCENLTNSLEILKSSYTSYFELHTSNIACFAGYNSRLAKRVGAGSGVEMVEEFEDKKEFFDNLSGKTIYIDGLDMEKTFDASEYENVVFIHIGKNINEDLDYDIWIPEGSLRSILEFMKESSEFSNFKIKFSFLYFIIKLIFAIFIVTVKIKIYDMLLVEIVASVLLIFATKHYGRNSEIEEYDEK